MRVEVELEGAEELQLLWDGERVRPRKRATSLTPSCWPETVTMAPPRPPGPAAHHCGRGEDAGRGVGSCHRGHLQEVRRQPLSSHRKILRARAGKLALFTGPKPRLALWGPISAGGAEPWGLESQ